MEDIISNEINFLKQSLSLKVDLSDEYLFSLVCYKYYYNNERLEYIDYKKSFVDGRADGGIDMIAIDDSHDQIHFILIQSKMSINTPTKDEFLTIFLKMNSTCKDFFNYNASNYSKKLKRIFKEKWDQVKEHEPIIEFVLFLYSDLNNDLKNKYLNEIEKSEDLKDVQFSIFSKNEIQNQIKNVIEPKFFVDEEKINYDKSAGIIKYSDNGIMINISALALKDIYDKHRDKGLFEQNFRYFVRNKKIDDSIRESLKNKRDRFWFMNNGIIIGADDYRIDGNSITIYKFSIVNGCQTTTLIGDSSFINKKNDFHITCKIVKPKENENFNDFISEIAEASNSQKPISDKDLKANKPEQRRLQNILKKEDPKIYLEIKRGEKLISYSLKKNLFKWQNLKNDFYGQLLLSFQHQMPGTARNDKKKIFSNPDIYNQLFKTEADKNFIIDLLKLNYEYECFLNDKIENDGFTDPDQENVASNGRYVILGVIGFMIKVKRNLIDKKMIKRENDWDKMLTDTLIIDKFTKYDTSNFKENLHSLFLTIIQAIASLFKEIENSEKTVSNLFKSDEKFRNIILKHIIDKLYEIPIELINIKKYLEIFY